MQNNSSSLDSNFPGPREISNLTNDEDHFLRNLSYTKVSVIHRKKPKKQIGPYIYERTIGEGSYSKVREFTHSENGKHVAIKTFSKKKMMRIPGAAEAVKREITLLQALNHQSIVNLIEVFDRASDSNNPHHNNSTPITHFVDNPEAYEEVVNTSKKCVVMELLPNGSLDEYVVEHHPLSVQIVKDIFKSIVSAVAYLHQSDIVHRDIKPDNIVFDGNWIPKITDFNTAENFNDPPEIRQWGSMAFQPPEVVKKKDKDLMKINGKASDVWALGVLLYYLATSSLPFSADEGMFPMLQRISEGTFEIPEEINPSIAEMIEFILVADPTERPTIEQLLQHTWCSDGFFSKCLSKFKKIFQPEPNQMIPDMSTPSPLIEPSDPLIEPPPPITLDDDDKSDFVCCLM
eukprot:TRINITY_DN1954_c0_g1_i1.p1 TRINITY_DN1954_c0_g1~~TRINITY_DN1954_c0_g1_i1.p1  ORF type:complete len:403 (+),score=126.54 TRINITY_DN1954_c0_g1_i1:79-1287(+)